MGGTPASLSPASDRPCYVQRPAVRPFDLLELHERDPLRYPHLLQSTAQGRFDILFAFPGESLALTTDTTSGPYTSDSSFLDALDRWWLSLQTPPCRDEVLPFTGGWFVYLGYELATEVEPTLALPGTDAGLPVAVATRITAAVIRDHWLGCTTLVAETGYEEQLASIETDIDNLSPVPCHAEPITKACLHTEAPPAQFLDSVRRILGYIREGDVFQVNLSRAWSIVMQGPVCVPVLYRYLRRHNPSPYSGIARFGDKAIVSSSPERLVRVCGDSVETRPIAGTRPRGRAAARDRAYSRELLAHPKERAEHIMLIDLERNDLGRICRPGSVRVDEFMVLESYAHVHHIVSNICGEMCQGTTPGQVIRAVFPGGTITGCPKVRCMEIIAELEQEPREAYTGSMGYLNRDGNMDLNILIRTMTVCGDTVHLRAGAGIVADSVPEAELEETRAKARGMLCAAGVTDD